ncbi:hypothetical protein [Oleiagrimonas sp.]|nr:hypothetical protein [Oleiagrimonas sp.]
MSIELRVGLANIDMVLDVMHDTGQVPAREVLSEKLSTFTCASTATPRPA